MKNTTILDETLDYLKLKKDLDGLTIKHIFLSNYFNIIQLNDDSLGTCMNYHDFKSSIQFEETSNLLSRKTNSDPLLLRYLSESDNLLKLNIKTCLVSALSRNLITGNSEFRISSTPDSFRDIDTAVVVGFGGLLNYLVNQTEIEKIHVTDLEYDFQKKEIDKKLRLYKQQSPNKKITVSNGSDNKQKIQEADLVSITGSAFCNGTMEDLLDYSKNCTTTIIQGQSASIYPKYIFKKGVSSLITTIPPTNLFNIAIRDFSKFKFVLEGGIPWVYIHPP